MKITKKRRDELKAKKKNTSPAAIPLIGQTPVLPLFPAKNVDNTEVLARLDKINQHVSDKPDPIIKVIEKSTTINPSELIVMNQKIDNLSEMIKNLSKRELVFEPIRSNGIIQKVLVKPIN